MPRRSRPTWRQSADESTPASVSSASGERRPESCWNWSRSTGGKSSAKKLVVDEPVAGLGSKSNGIGDGDEKNEAALDGVVDGDDVVDSTVDP